MIGAPAERDQPKDPKDLEYDLPLRPNSDPPARPYPDRLDPDWDHPEGVDFTEVEYEYEPKMGSARVIAYVGGIVVMAVASIWLVTNATNRRPFGTWTWSTPDLSTLSTPQVPDTLKRLPEGLARVPAETKRLLERATEAVTPSPSTAKAPTPVTPAPAAPAPVTPAPAAVTPPPAAPVPSAAKTPALETPAPTVPATVTPPPAKPELPPKPAPPRTAATVTPPAVAGTPAPAAIPTPPPPVAKATPPAKSTPPVAQSTPPVARATPPVAPRTSPSAATSTPPRSSTSTPSRSTTATPPRSATATPPSRPVAAPSTRPVEPLTVSANPTPTQRAAAAAAAAASTPAPRAAVEDAVRPSPAPSTPADVAPPPTSAAAANAPAAPPAAAPPAAAPVPGPEAPAAAVTPAPSTLKSPLVEADSAIRNVLGRYRTAFNVLDARAASDVWPTLDQRTLNRAFDQLAEQNVSFDNCAIDVKGVLAQARCTGTIRFVPKIGSRTAQVEPRRWDFTLRKAYSGWVIHEVRAR